MSSENISKLNLLQNLLLPGGVVTLRLLQSQGISQQLAHRYLKSGWLESLGSGAYQRPGDPITWAAALSAAQKQLGIPLHVGAKSALELKGFGQYLKLGQAGKVYLFGPYGSKKLPKWFLNQKWKTSFHVSRNNLFPKHFKEGLGEWGEEPKDMIISSPERAAFEMLYLVPEHQSWEEADAIFENLKNLRSKLIQSHIENCNSIRVKRLFMFLAHRHDHPWFKKLDTKKITLGSGKRSLYPGGHLDSKYQITIPPFLIKGKEQ